MKKEPYIEKHKIVIERFMNLEYDENDSCLCGHTYTRHFDSEAGHAATHCKHCGWCDNFISIYQHASCFGFENELPGERSLAHKALLYAAEAHGGKYTGTAQMRKYSGEPYIVHPIEVARILHAHGLTDPAVLAAAFLHDVVEDCQVEIEDIKNRFGEDVATLVHYVTDVSTKADGNRAARKKKDLMHYASGDSRSQSIKIADLLSNTRSIVVHDPDFAVVYIPEKRRTIEALQLAKPSLLGMSKKAIADAIVLLDTQGKRIRNGNAVLDKD